MVKLVTSLIFSRLDYCTAVPAGLPISTISPLQRIQNAAARLVAQLRPCDHVIPTMRDLHWLPVKYRITYKLCLLMRWMGKHNLTDTVTATLRIKSRFGLRSASSDRYEIPWSRLWFGECRFSVAGPKAWNNLPTRLHQTRSTVTFKWHLKSVELFEWAYISLFLFHYF